MHIAIPAERAAGETRVAATPETVKKLVQAGHTVTVEAVQAFLPPCLIRCTPKPAHKSALIVRPC